MNATLPSIQNHSTETPKAVVLYDRLESMLIANQLVGRLPLTGNYNGEWTVNSWRFDLLARADEGERALDETADAGLMMVATKGGSPADWPQEWLSRWAVKYREPAGALVAVLVGVSSHHGPGLNAVTPLFQLAERHNLEFLIVDCVPANAEQRNHMMDFRRLNSPADEVFVPAHGDDRHTRAGLPCAKRRSRLSPPHFWKFPWRS